MTWSISRYIEHASTKSLAPSHYDTLHYLVLAWALRCEPTLIFWEQKLENVSIPDDILETSSEFLASVKEKLVKVSCSLRTLYVCRVIKIWPHHITPVTVVPDCLSWQCKTWLALTSCSSVKNLRPVALQANWHTALKQRSSLWCQTWWFSEGHKAGSHFDRGVWSHAKTWMNYPSEKLKVCWVCKSLCDMYSSLRKSSFGEIHFVGISNMTCKGEVHLLFVNDANRQIENQTCETCQLTHVHRKILHWIPMSCHKPKYYV